MTGRDITDVELGAYVDGELDDRDAARIEAALAEDAALRAELRRLIEAREALSALAAETDRDPAAEELAARLGARLQAQSSRRSLFRVAASLSALAVTAAGGWFAHQASDRASGARLAAAPAPSFVADAVGAHAVFAPDRIHPVEFFSQDEALMRDWFAGHLGDDVRIPHLEEIGFDLVGGRLLGSARGPSAQLIYENAAGDRVSLVFGRQSLPEAPAAPRVIDVDGRMASWWRQGDFSFAVVEDGPGADVPTVTERVAEAVRRRR